MAIEGRPHESAIIASYIDVTMPCQRKDEKNGCFQEPLSLKLLKIEVIVSEIKTACNSKGSEFLADHARTDL